MSVDLKEQYDKIYRYCYLRTRNSVLAEDLTQETFLRFLEHEQYHDQNRDLQYLYTIARNLCIDEKRKHSAEELPEELPDKNTGEEQLLTIASLRSSLEALSDEDREIILLRYINEVPVSVMSRLYNISRFALNRRIKRILSQMKKDLETEVTE